MHETRTGYGRLVRRKTRYEVQLVEYRCDDADVLGEVLSKECE